MKAFTNLLRRLNKGAVLTVAMIIGTVAAISLAAFTSFAKQCEEVTGEVLRLHILANSDSAEDQELKYNLRDYLLDDIGEILATADKLDDAKYIVAENLSDIEKKAALFIAAQGFDYEVEAELVNMYFTTRAYENVTMPAGNYDALRLVIGEGQGQNWWCVAFPPLCLPVCTDSDDCEPYFSAEASKVIENGGRIETRFKVYEWFTTVFG